MSLMDVSPQDDCIVDAVVAPKQKKMKQARLPFQMLSSVEPQNGIPSKKRKLTSPSVEYKSPKVVKVTAKENSAEKKDETIVNDPNNTIESNSEISSVVEEKTKAENQEHPTLTESETPKSEYKSMPKGLSTGKGKKIKIKIAGLSDESKDLVDNTLETESEVLADPLKTPKSTQKRHLVGKSKRVEKKIGGNRNPLAKFLKQNKVEHAENYKDSSEDEKKDSEDSERQMRKVSKSVTGDVDDTMEEKDDAQENMSPETNFDLVLLPSDDEDKEDNENMNESERLLDTTTENPDSPKTPKLDKSIDKKYKRLTPKQQEKQLNIEKRKEERERLRFEKEKKLEEDRENKRREKEEKRKEKEEKEKAEREQKLKDKKLKEMKKQMELEQKQKEKEAKDEERRKREEAKEEEKRRKEEEKLEVERKKQKAVSNFASFFVAKKHGSKYDEEKPDEARNFMPFEVKADMKIAPVTRRLLSDQEKSDLDEKYRDGNVKKLHLYLNEIKNKQIIPRTSGRTWPPEAKDDIIVLDEENEEGCDLIEQPVVVEKHRPKLFQFFENRRPPYWGTWRKQSSNIKPRRPFATDSEWFNYEVDSDDEWEEEEPGESLHGSDDEKDEENLEDNEYDVDNEFMVPHGYLSDEEAQADAEEKEDMSPETQKVKLQLLGEQFECERQEKTSKLKPKVIGFVWQGPNNEFPENVPSKTVAFLMARQAWAFQIPVILANNAEADAAANGGNSTPIKTPTVSKKTKMPKEAIPDLIRLLHGNTHGKAFLVKEFITYWTKKNKLEGSRLSKASVMEKIRDMGTWMACPEEGPMHLKLCWYVSEEIRKMYMEGEELTTPNRWSYCLTPKRRSELSDITDKAEKEDKDKEKDKEKEKDKKTVPLITQFTKKITQEEMKKQLTSAAPVGTVTPKRVESKSVKRATLISVPRGEQLPKSSRENQLKTCFDAMAKMEGPKSNSKPSNDDSDDDDIAIIEEAKLSAAKSQINEKSTEADKTINKFEHVRSEAKECIKNSDNNRSRTSMGKNTDTLMEID